MKNLNFMKRVTKEEAYLHLMDRIVHRKPLAYDSYQRECLYNPKLNGGCSIGAHLGNNYSPKMEGRAVDELFFVFPNETSHFEDRESVFWLELQRAHDRWAQGLLDEETWSRNAFRDGMRHLIAAAQLLA